MKRQIGSKQYGSALGDFLRTRCQEIGEGQAGESGDGAAKGQAVAEELAGACGMSVEDFASVLTGDTDPTPEQADAMAAVLTKHGVEITGSDLLAIDKKTEEPKEDEAEKEGTETTEKALRAAQGEATEFRAKHETASTELASTRQELDREKAARAAEAPLVEAGRAAFTARKADVMKRLALRHGGNVPPDMQALVDTLNHEQLATYGKSLGKDPLVDPLCVDCGKKAPLYRSSEDAEPGSKPASLPGTNRALDAKPSSDECLYAARARVARLKKDGETVSEADAIRFIRTLTNDQIFELADEYVASTNR
jgi:transcriptional regulator with XRE-family HTH domain